YFANLADTRPCVTVFNVNTALRFLILRRVVVVIRHIAGAIFDEVILRIVTSGYTSAGRGQKIAPLLNRHVQINGFEETPRDEAFAEIGQYLIIRTLPLLDVKQNI